MRGRMGISDGVCVGIGEGAVFVSCVCGIRCYA